MILKAFLHQYLGNIFCPALDVRSISQQRPQQAPRFRLHAVGMLELDVMPRQGFVNGEPFQDPVVVLAQLRFRFFLRHAGGDGRDPIFRFRGRL